MPFLTFSQICAKQSFTSVLTKGKRRLTTYASKLLLCQIANKTKMQKTLSLVKFYVVELIMNFSHFQIYLIFHLYNQFDGSNSNL